MSAQQGERAQALSTTTTIGKWELRLYVAGRTQKSVAAFGNLQRICDKHLKGKYSIEVIDLLRNPALARSDQIVAIPTLVRKLPPPKKKIIGDLSNPERVLIGLDIPGMEAIGHEQQNP